MQTIRNNVVVAFLILALGAAGCGGSEGGEAENAGAEAGGVATAADIGPVKEVDLGPIDAAMAAEGQQIFETRCTVCHHLDSRYIGPPLADVTVRRDPVFVMNMILNPEGMLMKHPDVKQLQAEYGTIMTNQNLKEEEARAVLEYLRQAHEQAGAAPAGEGGAAETTP